MTLLAVLIASLAGSPHCAAMCGLIAGAAGTGRGAQTAWHASRLGGYLILGVVAGGAGFGLDRLGLWAGLTAGAARVAGIGLVVFGLIRVLAALGVRTPTAGVGHGLTLRLAARARSLPPRGRAALLGLLTAVLPCGWLYAFVAVAAGTGHPLRGALAMAVFWTGTVPAVAGAGLLLSRAAGPVRARLPILAGAAMIAFGLVTAFGRTGHVLSSSPAEAHDVRGH